MDNQSILRALTQKGFDFDASNLQARSLAIEKYRQYASTVEHYLVEAGIEDLGMFAEATQEIATDTTLTYLRHYDRLLKQAWIDRSFPIHAVQVNLNDMLCYGEQLASELHARLTALLDQNESQPSGLVDAEYQAKLAWGYELMN